MALEISPAFEERLKNEQTIWLTSVRADGTPQPTPVWFLWHNRQILIFSQPKAQKLRNIRHNPKVALNLNTDEWGGNVLIMLGDARIETAPVPQAQVDAYLEKYREGIKSIGMTPESLQREFSTPIWITPNRIRGE